MQNIRIHTNIIRLHVAGCDIGEDGAELSAAGQMLTFLGIKGFQAVAIFYIICL